MAYASEADKQRLKDAATEFSNRMTKELLEALVEYNKPSHSFMLGLAGISGALKGLRYYMLTATGQNFDAPAPDIDKMIFTALEGLFTDKISPTEIVAKMNELAKDMPIDFVDTERGSLN